MPKIILRIMGLLKILGRDYRIENPIGDPLYREQNLSFSRYFMMNPREKKEEPLDSCLTFAEDQPLCWQDVFLASAFHPVTDAGVTYICIIMI